MWGRDIFEQAQRTQRIAMEEAARQMEFARKKIKFAEQQIKEAAKQQEAAFAQAKRHVEKAAKQSSQQRDDDVTINGSMTSHDEDGNVVDTRDGWKTTYNGKSIGLSNNKLLIDGLEVVENDPRIVKREKASFNFGDSIIIIDGDVSFATFAKMKTTKCPPEAKEQEAAKPIDEEKRQLERALAESEAEHLKKADDTTSSFRLKM